MVPWRIKGMNNFNQREGKTFHRGGYSREYDFSSQWPEERRDVGRVWCSEAQILCRTDSAPVFFLYQDPCAREHLPPENNGKGGFKPFPSASSSRREAWGARFELESTFVCKLRIRAVRQWACYAMGLVRGRKGGRSLGSLHTQCVPDAYIQWRF